MHPGQIDIVTAAIETGDHVRVGTEDYPFARAGAGPTHQLVAESRLRAGLGARSPRPNRRAH